MENDVISLRCCGATCGLSEIFKTMLKAFYTLLTVLLFQNGASADDYIRQAKIIFGNYIKWEGAFDPAVADLYADSAVIRNTRHYPDGRTRVVTLTGKQYKSLIRQVMPLAKVRNDKSSYSQVTYKRIEGKVRISAKRYSLLKKYTTPIILIVMPDAKKKWLIVEEHSESRP